MSLARLLTRTRYGVAILAAALCGACSNFACGSAPMLNAVVPGTGYPRQLLAVDGQTGGASVVWDAGTADEMEITTGLLGTQYFQIPQDAAPGPHAVALKNASGTSSTVTVTVLPEAPFPAPRIEDIGIVDMQGAGPTDVLLTVSAANLDVDATVAIEETTAAGKVRRAVGPTVLWGGLPIDYLQSHEPDTFGYPVYHYAQQLVPVEDVTPGATLHITVTNTDGETNAMDVTVPASVDDLDSDGDGLLNSWEEKGYQAPSGTTIDLKALGVNAWKKDILIEVDMTAAVAIDPGMWAMVEQTFRDAPVLNPDGSAGITVIIDRGQSPVLTNGGQALPDHDCLTYDDPAPAPPPGCEDLRSFYEFKRDYFDSDRLRLFHYVVWGNRNVVLASGESELWGNDIAITLGGTSIGTKLNYQVGTFVHELGHNLALTHGDLFDDLENYKFKQNLPSVMSYRYQPNGVDNDCDLKTNGIFTYSQGTLKRLSEMAVDENIGICDNKMLDFNGDAAHTSGAMNLNFLGGPAAGADSDMDDEWNDFDQWGRIRLNFASPGSNWQGN